MRPEGARLDAAAAADALWLGAGALVAGLLVAGAAVVLAGPNGAGKTNLLDAISLLAPGRGLRGADDKADPL